MEGRGRNELFLGVLSAAKDKCKLILVERVGVGDGAFLSHFVVSGFLTTNLDVVTTGEVSSRGGGVRFLGADAGGGAS